MTVRSLFVLPLVLGFALGLPAAPASAQHAGHAGHAGHAAPSGSAPVAGKRFAADAPLRSGMRQVRDAVQALDHYRHGHMDARQAGNAAALIDKAVAGIMADCKLKPDADVALHGLLARFMAGAKAVRESKSAPEAAIADMEKALADYGRLFVDPGWGAKAP